MVEACKVHESPARALQQALDLQEVFDSTQLQVDAQRRALRDGPTKKPTADNLQDLYVSLVSCRNLLQAAGLAEEFDAPATTEGIFRLLLQRCFARLSVDKGYQIKRISYSKMVSFVKVSRDEANSNFGRLLESANGDDRFYKDRGGRRARIKVGRANAIQVDIAKPDMMAGMQSDKGKVSKENQQCTCCNAVDNHGL